MKESFWDVASEWFFADPVRVLLAVALVLLAAQTLRLYVAKNRSAWRVARHRKLGIDGEKRAKKLLHRGGYVIVEEQIKSSYALLVDGAEVTIHLRADYCVSKAGRTYIAEVKSGEESAKLTARATRRQLLEYAMAFSVDGLLLVDVAGDTIRSVEFPKRSAASRARTT